jgi:hypothetical protein
MGKVAESEEVSEGIIAGYGGLGGAVRIRTFFQEEANWRELMVKACIIAICVTIATGYRLTTYRSNEIKE